MEAENNPYLQEEEKVQEENVKDTDTRRAHVKYISSDDSDEAEHD